MFTNNAKHISLVVVTATLKRTRIYLERCRTASEEPLVSLVLNVALESALHYRIGRIGYDSSTYEF